MEKRPLVPVDVLLNAIRSGTHKITMAMIHPDDMAMVPSMERLKLLLRCEILPQHNVERGFIYATIKQVL